MPIQYSDAFNYRDYFIRCTTFLNEHRWIFEHANTKIVQAGVLDILLERTWIQDFKSTNEEELNQIPLGYINQKWSEDFKQFLRMVDTLSVIYGQKNYTRKKAGTSKGISPKKLYEIENLADTISEVCSDNSVLLDFGSGLGYLSQYLHTEHNFKVLGIEGDWYRVQAAQKRQSRYFPESKNHVKYIQHFIEECSFQKIQNAIAIEFAELRSPPYAIVGLHACADLSITAIKMFLSNCLVSSLAIMPCCYHKLIPQNDSCTEFVNIPISRQLKEALTIVGNILSRPFLRLGCQQTSTRWKAMTKGQHCAHGQAMFDRSLVEAIVDKGQFVTKNKQTFNNENRDLFERYQLCNESDPKCVLPWTQENRNKLSELTERYPDGGQLAEYLTCLQSCLQSLCENLILLDRMCFIETEAAAQGINMRINVVKFANDELSPRCFVIVAEKCTKQRSPS